MNPWFVTRLVEDKKATRAERTQHIQQQADVPVQDSANSGCSPGALEITVPLEASGQIGTAGTEPIEDEGSNGVPAHPDDYEHAAVVHYNDQLLSNEIDDDSVDALVASTTLEA